MEAFRQKSQRVRRKGGQKYNYIGCLCGFIKSYDHILQIGFLYIESTEPFRGDRLLSTTKSLDALDTPLIDTRVCIVNKLINNQLFVINLF